MSKLSILGYRMLREKGKCLSCKCQRANRILRKWLQRPMESLLIDRESILLAKAQRDSTFHQLLQIENPARFMDMEGQAMGFMIL